MTPELNQAAGSAGSTAKAEDSAESLPATWTAAGQEPVGNDELPASGLSKSHVAEAEYAVIRHVATFALSEPDPLTIACEAAHAVATYLGAASVAMWRFDGDEAHVVGWWPSAPPLDVSDPPGSRTVSPMPVARTGRTCWTTMYPPQNIQAGPVDSDSAVRATIAAPLVTPHGIWGAIAASWQRPVPETRDAGDRIEGVAVLLSSLIANAVDLARLTGDSRDPLTGLPTKSVFHDRLNQEVVRSQRHGHPLSLIMIAVNGRTELEDRPGHDGFDHVLEIVSRRIGRAARGGDVLGRLEGDAFGWLLPYCSPEGARLAADRLRAEIARSDVPAGGISVSIGTCNLEQVRDGEGLMSGAAQALSGAQAVPGDATSEYESRRTGAAKPDDGATSADHARTIGSVYAMSRAVDARDPSMFEHSRRVADLAGHLARQLGWSTSREVRLREAALLHDVGKVGVPDEILLKTTALTANEYRVARTHADIGAQIIAGVLDDEQVLWVRHHQERFDGHGYPDGLRGDLIPDGARILTVADTLDVMTSGRPYRKPLDPPDAVSEFRTLAGTQFCPVVVQALVELWNSGAFVEGVGHLGAFE